MASGQRYTENEIEFLTQLIRNKKNNKNDIVKKFNRKHPGRKEDNLKTKINKIASAEGIDLKSRAASEARTSQGDGKLQATASIDGL